MNVHIKKEILEKLREMAASEDRSVSYIINLAIVGHMRTYYGHSCPDTSGHTMATVPSPPHTPPLPPGVGSDSSLPLHASSPEEEKTKSSSGKEGGIRKGGRKGRRKPEYSAGFLKCWGAYPHVTGRSSKVEAWDWWRRLGLRDHCENVQKWIEALLPSHEWTRDDGGAVPAMHRWLKKQDFSELPPEGKTKRPQMSAVGQKTVANLTEWLEEQEVSNGP